MKHFLTQEERRILELFIELSSIDPQAALSTFRKMANGKFNCESTEEIQEAFDQERQALRN